MKYPIMAHDAKTNFARIGACNCLENSGLADKSSLVERCSYRHHTRRPAVQSAIGKANSSQILHECDDRPSVQEKRLLMPIHLCL